MDDKQLATKRIRTTTEVFGCRIDALSWSDAIETIGDLAERRAACWVSICNVHSVVTADTSRELQHAINHSTMATPDGMPLVWLLRKRGFRHQERINGPDLMLRLCEHLEKSEASIFLYGSTEQTLELLIRRLKALIPKLSIAGSMSPPFREMTPEEDADARERINGSGAGIVFVSLGCPKQELWMARNSGYIDAVLIGVGAAFDYHAGTVKRAQIWVQHIGLEWLALLICTEN